MNTLDVPSLRCCHPDKCYCYTARPVHFCGIRVQDLSLKRRFVGKSEAPGVFGFASRLLGPRQYPKSPCTQIAYALALVTVVPVEALWGQSIYYLGTWTLRVRASWL